MEVSIEAELVSPTAYRIALTVEFDMYTSSQVKSER